MPNDQKLTPEQEEDSLRRSARIYRHVGWLLMGGAFASALAGAINGIYQPNVSPNVRLYSTLGIIALVGAGAVMMGVGYAERINRPQRAHLTMIKRNQEVVLADLRALMSGQKDLADQGQLNAAALNRIEVIVKKVPEYAEGVRHGFELRAKPE